jgi:hypothetical protein
MNMLPPKNVVCTLFHKYKDVLMTKSAEELPARLEVLDKKHNEILTILISQHPRSIEKIGSGIKSFFVQRSIVQYDGKDTDVCCCYIKRLDDTEEDFSIFVCYKERSWKDTGTWFDSKNKAFKKREIGWV